jgi:hypothetical protein
LIVTIMWCLAALLWLPWALFAVRWGVDIAQGTPWDQSAYFQPVCMGIWPVHGWLRPWGIASWWPVLAFSAALTTAGGWRIYWLEQQGILSRPGWVVALSILLPPVSPFIMYCDARKRFAEREVELEAGVLDARHRINA